MTHLIDKNAVVAEIERFKKEEGWCQVGKDTADVYYARGFRFACERIISFLESLEVKEVNLEKEINKYISDNFFGSETMGFFAVRTNEELNDQDIACNDAGGNRMWRRAWQHVNEAINIIKKKDKEIFKW